MEQERPGGRHFHFEINSMEDFEKFVLLIRGETNTAETQAKLNTLAEKLNQASAPLEVALDQQKGQ